MCVCVCVCERERERETINYYTEILLQCIHRNAACETRFTLMVFNISHKPCCDEMLTFVFTVYS